MFRNMLKRSWLSDLTLVETPARLTILPSMPISPFLASTPTLMSTVLKMRLLRLKMALILTKTPPDYGQNNDCNSLSSFKRSYLDYHQEEITPFSYSDVFYLKTRDPKIINYLLRVYTFFSQVGFSEHGNIYSYVFEEQDDKYILTVNNIGAGINTDLLKNPDKYTDDSEMFIFNYRRGVTLLARIQLLNLRS